MSANADPESLCKQARRALRKGDGSQAIQLLRQAIEADGDYAGAHEGLGTACFLAKDYDGAIEHFTRASQLKPRDGKSLINLGAVYNRIGESQKAADALRRGIQRDSRSSEGYYNLGIAYRHLNDLSMAVSAYREAVRLNPEMAEAHHNLANVYVQMGNHRKAIEHYKHALEVKPSFERAVRGLRKAEEAASASKTEEGPFGRLVNEAAYAQRADEQVGRELTEAERFEDRQTIRAVSAEIAACTRVFLDHLKADMLSSLLSVSRDVSHGADLTRSSIADYEKFHDAIARSRQLRDELKQKIAELQAHERHMASLSANGS